MKKAGSRLGGRQRRSLQPLAWAALPVIGLGVGVVASGFGIDLFVIAVAGLVLLALERTVGDWMGETLGAGPASVIFGAAAAGCAWYLLGMSSGSSRTDRFFTAAESRGYRTALYQTAPPPTAVDTASESGQPQSGTTGETAGGPQGSAGVAAAAAPPDEKKSAEAVGTDAAVEKAREATRTEPTGAGVSPSQAGGVIGASRLVFGSGKKAPAPAASEIVLSLTPAQVSPARRTILRAVVTAQGAPVTEGSVEFVVDGSGAGKVRLGSGGVATTTFTTYISGTYEVRARFLGTTRYEPSSSGPRSLSVLPK